MIEKRIKTVQDLLDILQQVENPATTPLVMSDNLKFQFDPSEHVMYLMDEPQGNVKVTLPFPFNIFDIAHVYEGVVGNTPVQLFDVVDDNMIMVFTDPQLIHPFDEPKFTLYRGQVADADGDWQELIGLIYTGTILGYGMHINAEVSQEDLGSALNMMLQTDDNGEYVARKLGEYDDYFLAVCELYTRCYLPYQEETDLLNIDLSNYTPHDKLFFTIHTIPETEGETERVEDPDYEGGFAICTIWLNGKPIVQYGADTLSREEMSAQASKFISVDLNQIPERTLPEIIREMEIMYEKTLELGSK